MYMVQLNLNLMHACELATHVCFVALPEYFSNSSVPVDNCIRILRAMHARCNVRMLQCTHDMEISIATN